MKTTALTGESTRNTAALTAGQRDLPGHGSCCFGRSHRELRSSASRAPRSTVSLAQSGRAAGAPIGVEEAAKTAGGRGDRWGVGERLTGEDGQEGIRRLGQSGVAGAGIGAGQGAEGGSEPAAGVGVTPRVGVREHGGDGLAELTGVGGVPRLPARGLGVHRAGGGGARVRVCFAVRPRWPPPGLVIAAWTVGKISNCWCRPVMRRTLATAGAGAARRNNPPSNPARRPVATSTARPLASA